MELFKKTEVKILLLLELLAIAGFVTNYINLTQLLIALGFILLTFVVLVYRWSQAEKEDNNDS